jgi:hypothetical protein
VLDKGLGMDYIQPMMLMRLSIAALIAAKLLLLSLVFAASRAFRDRGSRFGVVTLMALAMQIAVSASAHACWAYFDGSLPADELKPSLIKTSRLQIENGPLIDIPSGYTAGRSINGYPTLGKTVNDYTTIPVSGLEFHFCWPGGEYPLEDMAYFSHLPGSQPEKGDAAGFVSIKTSVQFIDKNDTVSKLDIEIDVKKKIENITPFLESQLKSSISGQKPLRVKDVRFGLIHYGSSADAQSSKLTPGEVHDFISPPSSSIDVIASDIGTAVKVQILDRSTGIYLKQVYPSSQMKNWKQIYEQALKLIKTWEVQ